MSSLFIILLIATLLCQSSSFLVKRDHHNCDRTGKACLSNSECCRDERCLLVNPHIRCIRAPCGTACVKRKGHH
nr:putative venom toxin Tcis31 [Tityus cisandinus]